MKQTTLLLSFLFLFKLCGNAQTLDHFDSIFAHKQILLSLANHPDSIKISMDTTSSKYHKNKDAYVWNQIKYILYDVYGKRHIKKENPYKLYKELGCFCFMGSLKKGWRGGTFIIIFDSNTGSVIYYTHYK